MSGTLYVILRHEGIADPHFDLMFQTAPGSQLTTWRLHTWPPNGPQPADKLPDHRTAYLTYEGEISGGRGFVHQVERGICTVSKSGESWNIRLQSIPQGVASALRLVKQPNQSWICHAGDAPI